jgi:hypothetical protein
LHQGPDLQSGVDLFRRPIGNNKVWPTVANEWDGFHPAVGNSQLNAVNRLNRLIQKFVRVRNWFDD